MLTPSTQSDHDNFLSHAKRYRLHNVNGLQNEGVWYDIGNAGIQSFVRETCLSGSRNCRDRGTEHEHVVRVRVVPRGPSTWRLSGMSNRARRTTSYVRLVSRDDKLSDRFVGVCVPERQLST